VLTHTNAGVVALRSRLDRADGHEANFYFSNAKRPHTGASRVS
jgi:hypothetical protein